MATWGLLVLGASVRVHGAGLACPDWPLCFGQIIPALDLQVGLEFGHRVVAGLISAAFLALGWQVRGERRARRVWALAALALAVQVVLGGLTVLELLAEWTVTSHLLTGNLFCALLSVLYLALSEGRSPASRPPQSPLLRILAVSLAALVVGQVALGGLLASSYAGLACGTWPTCDGTTWFPSFSGPVGWQVTHRLVAYALATVTLTGAVWHRGVGSVGRAWAWAAVAVALQAVVGVANVLLRLPVEVTLLHSAGAAAVVLATTRVCWEAFHSPLGARVAAGGPYYTGDPAVPTAARTSEVS